MEGEGQSEWFFRMFEKDGSELWIVVIELESYLVHILFQILSENSFENLLLLFVREVGIIYKFGKHLESKIFYINNNTLFTYWTHLKC